jgi:hypothetical protein
MISRAKTAHIIGRPRKMMETEEINSILLISNNFIILIPLSGRFSVIMLEDSFINFFPSSFPRIFTFKGTTTSKKGDFH